MRVCVWQKKGKAWWKPFKGVNWSVEHCVRLHGGDRKKQLSARHSVVVIYCHKKWKHFKMLKVLKITSSRTTSVIHAVKSVSQHLDSVRSAVCQEPWQVWSFFSSSIHQTLAERETGVCFILCLTDGRLICLLSSHGDRRRAEPAGGLDQWKHSVWDQLPPLSHEFHVSVWKAGGPGRCECLYLCGYRTRPHWFSHADNESSLHGKSF